MKLKIKALSDSLEGLEELINNYFYSSSYYITVEGGENDKMYFKIKNRKGNIPFEVNKDYKVIYKKGKYYFYRLVSDELQESSKKA